METCYKVFRGEVIQKIKVEENRFGFEPEMTAKIAKLDVVICELGISCDGRTHAEGKGSAGATVSGPCGQSSSTTSCGDGRRQP